MTFSILTANASDSSEPLAADSNKMICVGDSLPAFSITTGDGVTVSPATLNGRPAIIVFFNTACGDCRKALGSIQRVYNRVGTTIGCICISREEDESDVATYWNANKLTLPYSAQSNRSVYNLFARHAIPRIYVADATGIIRTIFIEKVSEKKLLKAIVAVQ